MNSNCTFLRQKPQYSSPKTKVVFVKIQDILSVSNPDVYLTEMEEGNCNW